VAVLISVLAFYAQGLLKDLFLTALAVVWGISLLLILIAHGLARLETIIIDENSISHVSGILSTRRVVLSYPKITESKYSQNLLQRILGVGDLHIDSAGGSSIAIDCKNIRRSDLERILSVIGERSGKESGD